MHLHKGANSNSRIFDLWMKVKLRLFEHTFSLLKYEDGAFSFLKLGNKKSAGSPPNAYISTKTLQSH
jgi:hypothetical protein